ncbi:MAG: hypothetical protein ACT6RD_03500 [Brevundimonas sp.]|uniref:hypothetical protein n=1 Tax=Brevundimonas sp. TaxID=1871086 RepID=UPI00403393FF
MTTTLNPTGRRARVLRATQGGATLSDIVRRTADASMMSADRRKSSAFRLKTTSALRRLKADGLVGRAPFGWIPTAAGMVEIDRMEGRG